MSLADDLQKLQDLREEGALSEAEFQQAKEKLLDSDAQTPQPSGPQVNETHIRLDPGLTRAAERYTNTSSVASIIGMVVFIVFALIIGFTACSAFGKKDPGPFGDLCERPGVTCTR